VTRGSVVFLNRFYWPDVAATAQMLTDLAEGLAAAGWKVTVITSATAYSAATAVRPTGTRHGVCIVRVRGTRFGRARLLTRVLDQGTYLLGATLRLLRMPPADFVVAMSDPPLLLPIAVATARARGHKVVYWVQDLYPHLAARLGVITEDGALYRAWAALARWLYVRCARIVALGAAMAKEVVAAGAPAGRTVVVHNWVDTVAVRPLPRETNAWARTHGLAGKFVVLYAGNAGRAHTFEAVIEAAVHLRAEPTVVFMFVGGGAKIDDLQCAAERERLDNVRFFPYVAREVLGEVLSAGDVGLVTEDPRAAGLLLPSKIYGILAAGRPVLFVGSPESDTAAIVQAAACGFVVAPDDAEGIVSAIRELQQSPALGSELGHRARIAAEELYDRKHATERWDEVLSYALDG
jgi:colanic acid biosynthesis glycosyl transferase WcaI